MSVSNNIKTLLQAKNVKIKNLAEYLGIKEQSLHNKFTRDSFTANELTAIAEFSGVKLAFLLNDDEKILIKRNVYFYAPKEDAKIIPIKGQIVTVACETKNAARFANLRPARVINVDNDVVTCRIDLNTIESGYFNPEMDICQDIIDVALRPADTIENNYGVYRINVGYLWPDLRIWKPEQIQNL